MTKITSRFILLLLLSTLFFISCALVSSFDSDDSSLDDAAVFTLTDTNFDEVTGDGSWLLEFYAPWCGHCKKLEPVYEQVAKKLQKQNSPFRLAKIDATVEKDLAARFQIRSFPTLKFKRGEEFRSYNGARTAEALLSYAHEMSGPPVQSISSTKALKSLTNKHPILFALFSSSAKSDEALKAFNDVAFRLQGVVKFAHIATDGVSEGDSDGVSDSENEEDAEDGNKSVKTAKKLMKKYGLDAGELPAVVAVSAGEETEPFTGPFDDTQALKDFVWTNRHPLISELEGGNFEELTTQGKMLVLLIIDPKSTQQAHTYTEAALPVAKKYKGKYIFVTVDGNKFSQYVAQFNVDPAKDLPTAVVLDYPEYYYSAKAFYPLSGSLPAHQVDEFVDAVDTGSVSASGTIPWYNPQRYLKKLERFLSGLSTVPFVVTVVLMTVVFVSIIFFICKCLIGFDGEEEKGEEDEGEEEEQEKTKDKEKIDKDDKSSKKAEESTQPASATSPTRTSSDSSSSAASEAEGEVRQRKSKRAD